MALARGRRGGVQEGLHSISTKHPRDNTRLRCFACTCLSAGSVGLGSGECEQLEVNSPQGRNTLCGCMRSSHQEPCQLSRLPLPARPHHRRTAAVQILYSCRTYSSTTTIPPHLAIYHHPDISLFLLHQLSSITCYILLLLSHLPRLGEPSVGLASQPIRTLTSGNRLTSHCSSAFSATPTTRGTCRSGPKHLEAV
jgi:hypothetical protein